MALASAQWPPWHGSANTDTTHPRPCIILQVNRLLTIRLSLWTCQCSAPAEPMLSPASDLRGVQLLQRPIPTEKGSSSSSFLQRLVASSAPKQVASPSADLGNYAASLQVQHFPVDCSPSTPGGRFQTSPSGEVLQWLFHHPMSYAFAFSKEVWISAGEDGGGRLFLGLVNSSLSLHMLFLLL